MLSKLRVLNSKTIFKGKVVELSVDRVIEPGGLTADRELIHHQGSAVVLPLLPDGRILLVRQFRYAARKPLWELVAGLLEPGEEPMEGARRELLEETGYRPESLRHLFTFYPSPGFLNERVHLFEATGLTRSKAQPEADERIRLGRFTMTQLRQRLSANKIEDGKTLMAVLWLISRRRR